MRTETNGSRHSGRRLRAYLSIAAVCFAAAASAVEIEADKVYPPHTVLESSTAGVTLTVPAGFNAAWPAGTDFVVLATPDQQRLIFVYVAEMNAATAQQLMAEPIDLGDGIVLVPRGTPGNEAGRLTGTYDVAGSAQPMVSRIHTRIGEHGIGTAFISLALPTDFDAVDATAIEVATATSFRAPEVPEAAVGGAGSWQEYMRGRYVVRYYTGSGYSEEEHIWLCSDGTFARSSSAGGFGGGASGAFGGQGSGRWQALGTTSGEGELVLQYGAGSVTQTSTTFGDSTEYGAGGERLSYSLTLTDEGLMLNGGRWYRDTNQRCN